MNALNTAGTGFSMDNFGTGYSSLSYLTKLPFNQIKIDRSVVHNIDIHATDAQMIQTIIGVAKKLDMGVIAEAVETENQRAFLESHGCLLYQGCLFSPPLPIELFEKLLHQ
jgi:EAL domain-containing protein (putative c-di-GMP-specific phosphodiesterase class I)